MTKARRCGTCTACCTTHSIPELDKPHATPCPKLGDKGCSIYGQHPASCKGFQCLWLRGAFEGAHRPDRLGLVFDVTEVRNGVQSMVAREAWPDALEGEEAKLVIEYYSMKVPIIRINARGERMSVIGPAHMIQKAVYGNGTRGGT